MVWFSHAPHQWWQRAARLLLCAPSILRTAHLSRPALGVVRKAGLRCLLVCIDHQQAKYRSSSLARPGCGAPRSHRSRGRSKCSWWAVCEGQFAHQETRSTTTVRTTTTTYRSDLQSVATPVLRHSACCLVRIARSTAPLQRSKK